MNPQMLITAEKLETLRVELSQLPEPKREGFANATDAMKAISTELQAMLERGYTRAQVVEFLNQRGLKVSVRSLNAAVPGKRKRAKKKQPSEVTCQKGSN
jgi:hypothetical protein